MSPSSQEEPACEFISTRGIAKSCTYHPIWKEDGTIDFPLSTKNTPGSTIYLMFDWVESFIQQISEKMEAPFILVTGNSDHTTPNDFPSAHQLLNNPKCLAWYSQNCVTPGSHPKLRAIPIGLDYHTLSFSRGIHEWGLSGTSPFLQEQELKQIKNAMKPLKDTTCMAITNFHLAMDSPPRRYFYRQPAYQGLKYNSCVKWLPRQTRAEFWRTCNEYAFVISPFGNGLDTHRTWEVLCLGRIPIIKKSPMNVIFAKLPIVEVETWKEINEEWLIEHFYKVLKNMEEGYYDLSRLTLAYWMNNIHSSMDLTYPRY